MFCYLETRKYNVRGFGLFESKFLGSVVGINTINTRPKHRAAAGGIDVGS